MEMSTATGNISTFGSASIAGSRTPNAEEPEPVDLTAMDYAREQYPQRVANLPGCRSYFRIPAVGNALRDVFVKNPSDRSYRMQLLRRAMTISSSRPAALSLGTEKTGANAHPRGQ